MQFCALGALQRAAFELTGDVGRALGLRYYACDRLLPHGAPAEQLLSDLNDTSIGYCTVLSVFEAYLEKS